MIRGYTNKQVSEMGFPTKDYDFPKEAGSFTGTLALKRWGRNGVLVCYFDTDDGEKVSLGVWSRHKKDRTYPPKNCDLDLASVEIGSRMRVEYDVRETGTSRMLEAEVLEEPEHARGDESESASGAEPEPEHAPVPEADDAQEPEPQAAPEPEPEDVGGEQDGDDQ